MYYKKGMKVMVNKNITRVKEWKKFKDLSEQEFEQIANENVKSVLKRNDTYVYLRAFPIEELYANQGEIGEIIDLFQPLSTGWGAPWYAKVKIDDKIKTFRLTSLDILN